MNQPRRHLSVNAYGRAGAVKGFTLIEIIIVLLIISISAAIVELSMSNRMAMATLEQEADQLRSLLNFASDYSLIHQQPLGLSINASGYALVTFNDSNRTWDIFKDAPAVQKKTDDIHVSVLSRASIDAMRNLAGPQPAVIIYSDGSFSRFALTMQWQDDKASQLKIALAADGTIGVSSAGDVQ
jgi:general secretion pathway protein H